MHRSFTEFIGKIHSSRFGRLSGFRWPTWQSLRDRSVPAAQPVQASRSVPTDRSHPAGTNEFRGAIWAIGSL